MRFNQKIQTPSYFFPMEIIQFQLDIVAEVITVCHSPVCSLSKSVNDKKIETRSQHYLIEATAVKAENEASDTDN